MEARKKVITTFAVLVVLIMFLYFFASWFSKTTGYGIKEDPDNEMAKCLTEKGTILYTADDCSECRRQKAFFGVDSYQYVSLVQCSKNPEKCSNLRVLPAWYINSSFHYGAKTLTELRKLSGCD